MCYSANAGLWRRQAGMALHGWRRTEMHILTFMTAINPVVLVILGLVVACGAVDWWIKSH
jgi:hypothetical protein